VIDIIQNFDKNQCRRVVIRVSSGGIHKSQSAIDIPLRMRISISVCVPRLSSMTGTVKDSKPVTLPGEALMPGGRNMVLPPECFSGCSDNLFLCRLLPFNSTIKSHWAS